MRHVEPATSQVFETLRSHVQAPLETAERRVERETEEVAAEKRAFAEFRERVAAVETIGPSSATPVTKTYAAGTHSNAVDRLRNAFRETVMDVDHYERVYDESLDEHAVAELSADAATALRSEATPLTPLHRRALVAAATAAVEQRETVLEMLNEERASLAESRDAIEDLLDACAGAGRERLDVADRLDDVAASRQETVQSRSPTARTDGHDLCSYLYDSEDWTYPVLTAVARFRRST